MANSEEVFQNIKNTLIENYTGVSEGKMMASPAVQYNKKVFCFYYNESMCFRLGKNRDVYSEFRIENFELLSPFKNKPPLGGWFIIPKENSLQWELLAKESYNLISQ